MMNWKFQKKKKKQLCMVRGGLEMSHHADSPEGWQFGDDLGMGRVSVVLRSLEMDFA